jgi:ribosomal protein S18 acetylase RimI-like enzyme
MSVDIRELADQDREWARDLLVTHWGSAVVVSRGRLHDADRLPGFVGLVAGAPSGLVTYRVEGNQCEVVTLNSLIEGRGVGTALLAAVADVARRAACHRIWLITTNDNHPAIGFYRRRGFALAAVHEDAIRVSRKLKPEIPELGHGGIPIRDELEFELFL